MSNPHFASYTAHHAASPALNAQTLSELAQARPDLWPHIAVNPNCDPHLAASIRRALQPQPMSMPPNAAAPDFPVNKGGAVGLIAVSVLSIIALYLPAASAGTQSVSFAGEDRYGFGIVFLIPFLLVGGLALVGLLTKHRGLIIATGILGIIFSPIVFFLGVTGAAVGALGVAAGGKFGVASGLLVFCAIAMFIFGIVALIQPKPVVVQQNFMMAR